jgi:hypothetical protein
MHRGRRIFSHKLSIEKITPPANKAIGSREVFPSKKIAGQIHANRHNQETSRIGSPSII